MCSVPKKQKHICKATSWILMTFRFSTAYASIVFYLFMIFINVRGLQSEFTDTTTSSICHMGDRSMLFNCFIRVSVVYILITGALVLVAPSQIVAIRRHSLDASFFWVGSQRTSHVPCAVTDL